MNSDFRNSKSVQDKSLVGVRPGARDQLTLSHINVDFGATRALADVSMTIKAGQVVGLVGHNGAGKSTLFNVISGALAATSGTVMVAGVEAAGRTTPKEMALQGITVIHQEPALAQNLSIIDNLFLGQESFVAKGERSHLAQAALDQVGAGLDLAQPVSSLTLGERQLVDLARGLVRGDIKVLMLDEPTAALGKAETDILHGLIRKLAATGVSVIYVSHRLPDILEVCDRVVILRAGQIQSDGPASLYDGKSLSKALSPDTDISPTLRPSQTGAEYLSCSGEFSEISAFKGEVLGLFGMASGRQFSLLEKMFGLHGKYSFCLGVDELIISRPRQAVEMGIHLVPADRENDGVISGLSAKDTVFLPWYRSIRGKGLWISRNAGQREYQAARHELQIAGPGANEAIDEFSGGNRQKHLIARWALIRQPKVLLLSQPTQGVDIGARADIARSIHEIADQGVTVLVSSAESDEIALLCDRAYVMTDKRTVEVQRGARFGEELLQTLLTVASNETKELGV